MDNPPPTIQPKPIIDDADEMQLKAQRGKVFTVKRVIIALVSLLVLAAITITGLYFQALRPVNTANNSTETVEIISGMMPGEIAAHLKEAGMIRSELAFSIYTRITGVHNNLQAGIYQLSRQMSAQEIANLLVKGPENSEFEITFLPGATLEAHRQVLVRAGFSESEINTGLMVQYDHPLLTARPSGSDLEGYILGETHRFTRGTSVQAILERFFDDYYKVVQENQLIERYQAQGLSLHKGITLASIIERESGGDDKTQISQIFLLRLQRGMQLGSDVTYQYIADKEGNPRDINYDSPYNTRRYTGLPPGPIASPGVESLKAVANPALGDYLYFLSGDDDVTYYARTFAEHETNIRNHCQRKCQII